MEVLFPEDIEIGKLHLKKCKIISRFPNNTPNTIKL